MVMVSNLTKTLDDHTKNSSDFYKEIRTELNDIKESNSTLHIRVGILEKSTQERKPKVENLDNKMFGGMVGGGVILWVIEHFLLK